MAHESGDQSDDCAEIVIPSNTEVNTFLDLEGSTLEFSWWDASLGQDKVVTISLTDDSCQSNPSLAPRIQHVLVDAALAQAEDCQWVEGVVSGEIETIRNQPAADVIDMEAARQYLSKLCSRAEA